MAPRALNATLMHVAILALLLACAGLSACTASNANVSGRNVATGGAANGARPTSSIGSNVDARSARPSGSDREPRALRESEPAAPARDIVVPDLGAAACKLAEPKWTGNLQLRPGGSPFAFLVDTPITLALGVESQDGSGRVSVDRDGVRLTGALDAPEIFAKGPARFSGFVFPQGTTPLAWAGSGKVGKVVAVLDVSAVFDEPRTVEAPLGCDQASLHPVERESDPSTTLRRKPLRSGSISGPTDLTLVPGKAPIAKLKKGLWPASVLREDGKNVEVVINLGGFYALAWAPASSFNDMGVGVGESGSGGAGIGSSHSSHRYACTKDLELFAEAGGERARVGALAAGTPFVQSDTAGTARDDYLGLDLQLSWMAVTTGARIVVRRSAFEACNEDR